MRLVPFLVAVVCGFAALFSPGAFAGDVWHATLEKGLEAAKKAGRPVFLVTLWKTGV